MSAIDLKQYNIESTIPCVTNEDDEGLEIPGYGWASICTSHARYIAEKEGGEVFGFMVNDNPAPGLLKIVDGHDFAVIDGRWIVDTWARFWEEIISDAVIDMHDPLNAELIQRFYGDPMKWVLVESFLDPSASGVNSFEAVQKARSLPTASLGDIKIKAGTGTIVHVDGNAYSVEVTFPNESKAYHDGPGDYPYFTKEEAEKLVSKINEAGAINPANFVGGNGFPLDVSESARLELEEERQREDEMSFGM